MGHGFQIHIFDESSFLIGFFSRWPSHWQRSLKSSSCLSDGPFAENFDALNDESSQHEICHSWSESIYAIYFVAVWQYVSCGAGKKLGVFQVFLTSWHVERHGVAQKGKVRWVGLNQSFDSWHIQESKLNPHSPHLSVGKVLMKYRSVSIPMNHTRNLTYVKYYLIWHMAFVICHIFNIYTYMTFLRLGDSNLNLSCPKCGGCPGNRLTAWSVHRLGQPGPTVVWMNSAG